MRYYVIAAAMAMMLGACGGNNNDKGTGTTDGGDQVAQDALDTASVRKNAMVMAADMSERLSEGDMETLAALAQEATDNLSYSMSHGDKTSAGIYADVMRAFICKNASTIGDMASQNYVIKQFVVTVVHMPHNSSDSSIDSLLHHIASPISTAM